MSEKENKNRQDNTEREDTCRVILNVPESLDKSFRDLAMKRGLSKSNMIIFAMSWYLDYCKTLDLMPMMLEGLKEMEKQDQKKEDEK